MKDKSDSPIVSQKYPSGVELLRGETKKIFMALLEHTPIQVGYLFGLDQHYTTDASIRTGVYKAYQWVLADPKKYGVPIETAQEVEARVKERTIGPSKAKALKKQEKSEMQKVNTTELLLRGTDRSLMLLHKKLDELEKGKGIKEIKITDLVKVVSALFDKGQIARGEATQNIAVLSRSVPADMSTDEALAEVLRARDNIAEQKEAARDK